MASGTTVFSDTPNKKGPEPPNKRPNSELLHSPEYSMSSTPPANMELILQGINEKLKKLDKLDVMADDIRELKETTRSTGDLLDQTRTELGALKGKVNQMETSIHRVNRENLKLRERMLEITTRSMRDNLIFSGIPEIDDQNAEVALRSFLANILGLSRDTVQKIGFHRVHRLGAPKTPDPEGSYATAAANVKTTPRAIIACFEQSKFKETILGLGPKLKGKPSYGMFQQFPGEIVDRRKALLPLLREHKKKKGGAKLVVDRLYIDGKLYKDPVITPWLYLFGPDDADE